jgi:putative flippase GtrA
MNATPVPFWKSFSRAQIASFAATGVDFGFLILLVEKGGAWYVAATAAGAFLGAVTNFTLNRQWSFESTSERIHGQALKYALVSGGSLVLNSGGVWAFTEGTGISYLSSKILTSLLVGLFFNFPLHRYFVFRASQ